MPRVFAILGLCCWLSPAAAQLALPPELCLPVGPAEQRLLEDLADGRLEGGSILEAALVAAGTEDAAVCVCLEAVKDRVADWRRSGIVEGTPRQRAEKLFELMHQELLYGGYHHDANSLTETVLRGRFNCVSATLLWQHLAAEFQISAIPRQLPGHVQSVLILDDTRLIVETTCPGWFSLIDDEGRLRQADLAWDGRPTITDACEARELDDPALIAAVYYNRGLALLAQREFAAAVAASHVAHRLDPVSTAARGNLLATLNNWALHLAEQGQTARALWLLETGRAAAPEHESFRVNLEVLRGTQP